MEFRVTDLLDDFQDATEEFCVSTTVSEDRIQKLTMSRIQRKKATVKNDWAGRLTARVALIAAILVCLSVTVLATTGFELIKWLAGDGEEVANYDNTLNIGANSNNWGLSGWLLELEAEKANAWGLTITCVEWGSRDREGVLTTDEAYWLEKWNGSGYERFSDETDTVNVGKTIALQANTTVQWPISWKESYGELAPGAYRLGKNFRHTSDSGETQEMKCYVKFRVFEGDWNVYYQQYEAALKELYDEQNRHLTIQVHPESPEGYYSYSREIWKSGEGYVESRKYLGENGSVCRQDDVALCGGVGYRLNEGDGRVDPEATQWTQDHSIKENGFNIWYTFFELSDVDISDVLEKENSVIFRESKAGSDELWETVLTTKENGEVESVCRYKLVSADTNAEERELCYALVVHQTDETEITELVSAVYEAATSSVPQNDEQAI